MANEFRVRKKLIVNGSGSTILDVQGSQGQLFSVTDSLSGSLFSVKDISGIPVIEVFSDDTVNIGTFNAEAIKVSGSFARITGSLFGTASFANSVVSSSYAATASVLLGSVTSASYASTASLAVSSSYSDSSSTAVSSSYAATASYVSSTSIVGNLTQISSGSVSASVNTDTSASFRITSGSNTLMNVTKDGFVWIGNGSFVNQGYQLDVNGTVRVTSTLLVQNSTGNAGATFSNSSTQTQYIEIKSDTIYESQVRLNSSTSNYGWSLTQNQGNFYIGSQPDVGTSAKILTINRTNSNVLIQSGTTQNYAVVTAMLQVDSTTKGFLPPRMTSTQKNAIASPAQGLHVYDTGSSTEGLWYYSSGSIKAWTRVLNNTGSQDISGSLAITGSLSTVGSNTLIGNTSLTGSVNITGSTTQTGNNTLIGNTQLTGSIGVSGSQTFVGNQTLTGSFLVSGSTVQVGNNTLFGNTVLTGSIVISSSFPVGSLSSSVQIYGDTTMTGYLKFNPQSTNIDTSISASYIFVSGSTNDLYFSQNTKGYANTTRLRWIEGNLYTGLLHGGLITTQSSTSYQVSSGSAVIVLMNASIEDDPYPTTTFIQWNNLSASIAPLSSSFDQSFIAIEATGSTGKIYAQGTPYDNGQFNTLVPIGNVIHQNRSTINATATYPSVAYAYKQRSSDFLRAFGALKLSGLTTIVSGSTTGSLSITSGTAYSEGRNYSTDPNNPSYVIDTGQPISKIFRYYQSGSGWAYLTNAGAGFETIDPTQYSNNGVLTAVPGTGVNRRWTIQRVFYFPAGATKGIYVYYGNQTYASQIEAVANIPYETFIEAPNTAAGAILSAYLIVRNNADFTVADSYNIQQAGLFRNIGGAGGGGSSATTRLVDLSDVSITSPTDHQPFAYDASILKWTNQSSISASLKGNADTATTASNANTASYALAAAPSYIDNFVTVGLSGSNTNYNSIKTAVDSIVDASQNNTYTVKVYPGVYIEDTITMKSWIAVKGDSSVSTVVSASNPSASVFVMADQSMIIDLQVQGSTAPSASSVYYSSPTTPQTNAISYVENVRFGANYTHAKVVGTGSSGNCIMQCSNVKYGGYPFTLGFYATNTGSAGVGRMQLRNVTSTNGGVTTTTGLVFAKADQPNCAFIVNGALLTKAAGAAAGTGFWVENGGSLRLTALNFQRWATAIYAPNTGSAPSIFGSALNFENNTIDVLVQHPSASGHVEGTDTFLKTQIPLNAPLYEVNQDPRRFTVAKKGGDFTSISASVAYITDSSENNRYVIEVGPGQFIENTIDLTGRPYVSIVGSNIQTTEIFPSSSTQHIIKLGINNEVSFLSLGEAGPGYAGLYVDDIGDFGQAHKISFYNCDTNVFVTSRTQDTQFYGEYLDYNGTYTYGTRVSASAGFGAYANIENYYQFPSGSIATIGNLVEGENSDLNLAVASFDGSLIGVSGATAIKLQNSASCDITSIDIIGWDYGLSAPNIGGNSSFNINGTVFRDSITYDFDIAHPTTSGRFQGSGDHTKINNASNDFFWSFMDITDGEFDITRKLSVTFEDGTHTDATTLIFKGSPMGVMQGGEITISGSLTINTAAGFGYLENSLNPDVYQRIDWLNSTLVLSANTNNYIYLNDSGVLSAASSTPDINQNIILGRVVTNNTGIEFIDQSPYDGAHMSNKISKFNRDALGPVFADGSIVSENVTPFKLNVTQGSYFFSENNFTPAGTSSVNFTQYYRSASAWDRSQTSIVTSNTFDSGSNVLSPLSASAYTKHTLYLIGEGVDEEYFLVIGQNEYGSLVEAEGASLPTPPTYFNDGMVPLASIYVRSGSANIIEIQDVRPVIGFRAAGVNASATHGNLLGLTADDHLQYLLVDGTRQMSGDLGLGGNDIYNVTQVSASIVLSPSITGSLQGTASWARNAITASYVLNAVSASYAATAALAPNYVLTSTTSSMTVLSASFATTSSYADNFTVKGTLTAQTIVVQTITSSTDFVTGSTKFGSVNTNTHQFTGSVSVSSSLSVNGSAVVTSDQTGSFVTNSQTSSFVTNSQTSSFVTNSQTSSFVQNSQTSSMTVATASFATSSLSSSYAATASFAPLYVLTSVTASMLSPYLLSSLTSSFVTNGQTASFVQNSQTGSFAITGSNRFVGDQTITGSLLLSSSAIIELTVIGNQVVTGSLTVTQGITGSLFGTSSWSQNSVTSSYVLNSVSASYAATAALAPNYVLTSVTGSMLSPYLLSTQTSSFVTNNQTSSFVQNSQTSSFVTNDKTGSFATTGSNKFVGDQTITGSLTLSSSAIIELTVIGNQVITGSLTVTQGITGSLFGTSSWSQNAVTSSYVLNSVSASYAATAALAPNYVLTSVTGSMLSPYVLSSNTSSFVTNSQTSSFVTNSQTSSFVLNSQTSSMTVATASFATSSLSASYASNGGVTQIVAGTNVSISPISGLGSVTINAAAGAAFPYTGSALITGSLIVTGSTTSTLGFTGSLFGTSSWSNNSITASYVINAVSASYAATAALAPNYVLTSVTASMLAPYLLSSQTSSFVQNSQTSSMTVLSASFASTSSYVNPLNQPLTISGSLTVTSSIRGTFDSTYNGTNGALRALNAASQSKRVDIGYDTTMNGGTGGGFITAQESGVDWRPMFINAVPTIAAPVIIGSTTDDGINKLQVTGNGRFIGNITASAALINGTITAQTLIVQTITSSTDFVTGSTRFGSLLTNTHQFTGSVSVTGSLVVNNNIVVTSNQTSSFVTNSQTSSFVTNSQTGSFAITGSNRFVGNQTITGSLILSSSALVELTVIGNQTITGSLTVTQGITGSLFGTSSWSQNAVSASWAPSTGGGGGLKTKAGSVINTSFTGNPEKATVTFATAFPNTDYAITVTGEDARSWTIESKAVGSFVINSNSNIAPTGTTYWIATAYGETV